MNHVKVADELILVDGLLYYKHYQTSIIFEFEKTYNEIDFVENIEMPFGKNNKTKMFMIKHPTNDFYMFIYIVYQYDDNEFLKFVNKYNFLILDKQQLVETKLTELYDTYFDHHFKKMFPGIDFKEVLNEHIIPALEAKVKTIESSSNDIPHGAAQNNLGSSSDAESESQGQQGQQSSSHAQGQQGQQGQQIIIELSNDILTADLMHDDVDTYIIDGNSEQDENQYIEIDEITDESLSANPIISFKTRVCYKIYKMFINKRVLIRNKFTDNVNISLSIHTAQVIKKLLIFLFSMYNNNGSFSYLNSVFIRINNSNDEYKKDIIKIINEEIINKTFNPEDNHVDEGVRIYNLLNEKYQMKLQAIEESRPEYYYPPIA